MKTILFALLLAVLLPDTAQGGAPLSTYTLCSAVTTVSTAKGIAIPLGPKTFQAKMTVSSGSGTGAISIQGSFDDSFYDTLGTLSITDLASDSIATLQPNYQYFRCNVTGITGTGAAITVTVGN